MSREDYQNLDVFKRAWAYIAGDTSEIRLGPQAFVDDNGQKTFGSIAAATFNPGASTAVLHNTVSEQWYYLDGPDFYFWLCPQDEPNENGEYFLIKPGMKFEVPPKHKIQVFNFSEAPVSVLLLVYPFWPQDKSVEQEVLFPVGPWQVRAPCDFVAKDVDKAYMEHLYTDDPIALRSKNGSEYINNVLESIDVNQEEFRLAGNLWSSIESNEWVTVPNDTSNPKVVAALNQGERKLMDAVIAADEQRALAAKEQTLKSPSHCQQSLFNQGSSSINEEKTENTSTFAKDGI